VILDDDRIAWCNDTARLHLEIDPTRTPARRSRTWCASREFLAY
jgi:hypothetical protein